MTYVIAEPCIGTKDTSCVDVCPVDCIHPTKDEPEFEAAELLYIHPDECIDCGACEPACPVQAIFTEDDLPDQWKHFLSINANYYDSTIAIQAPQIRDKPKIENIPPPQVRPEPIHTAPIIDEPSAPITIRAGVLIGPYFLVNQIGRGAFGKVWLAERRTRFATTRVALKLPLDEDTDLDIISQEANLWAQATGHPNVLPIIEADLYNGHVVIVSEYASDGSLEDWLKRNGGSVPFIQMALDMSFGILSGLEHLHSRRIIHRDLKPANILLQGSIPRLADFGISRLLKSTGHTSIVAGTPAYMAPEAFDGKRNEKTDIWSAAVIIYQLLSGHLPFPQKDIPSLWKAIAMYNPDPLPPSVPERVQQVIYKALEKEPENRYDSASELRSALRNAL